MDAVKPTLSRCDFFGGPEDGALLAIEDDGVVVEIPIVEATDKNLVHVYARSMTTPTLFIYAGEKEKL